MFSRCSEDLKRLRFFRGLDFVNVQIISQACRVIMEVAELRLLPSTQISHAISKLKMQQELPCVPDGFSMTIGSEAHKQAISTHQELASFFLRGLSIQANIIWGRPNSALFLSKS